jgi:arginine-tRNA-protein transferase
VVDEFRPDRSQRRNLRANGDLELRIRDGHFSDEHIELYTRYIRARHPGDSMDVESKAEVERFFLCDWSDTFFIEFRLDGRLVALSVVDALRNGLSAVYTFFDPDEAKRGLGVYAVLSLVEEAKRRHLPYVYLGYLIHESPKMAYKSRYQPLQQLRNGRWLPA